MAGLKIKYTLFYPETNERIPGCPEFDTESDAVIFWQDKRADFELLESDEVALINHRTGTIVVVRAISKDD